MTQKVTDREEVERMCGDSSCMAIALKLKGLKSPLTKPLGEEALSRLSVKVLAALSEGKKGEVCHLFRGMCLNGGCFDPFIASEGFTVLFDRFVAGVFEEWDFDTVTCLRQVASMNETWAGRLVVPFGQVLGSLLSRRREERDSVALLELALVYLRNPGELRMKFLGLLKAEDIEEGVGLFGVCVSLYLKALSLEFSYWLVVRYRLGRQGAREALGAAYQVLNGRGEGELGAMVFEAVRAVVGEGAWRCESEEKTRLLVLGEEGLFWPEVSRGLPRHGFRVCEVESVEKDKREVRVKFRGVSKCVTLNFRNATEAQRVQKKLKEGARAAAQGPARGPARGRGRGPARGPTERRTQGPTEGPARRGRGREEAREGEEQRGQKEARAVRVEAVDGTSDEDPERPRGAGRLLEEKQSEAGAKSRARKPRTPRTGKTVAMAVAETEEGVAPSERVARAKRGGRGKESGTEGTAGTAGAGAAAWTGTAGSTPKTGVTPRVRKPSPRKPGKATRGPVAVEQEVGAEAGREVDWDDAPPPPSSPPRAARETEEGARQPEAWRRWRAGGGGAEAGGAGLVPREDERGTELGERGWVSVGSGSGSGDLREGEGGGEEGAGAGSVLGVGRGEGELDEGEGAQEREQEQEEEREQEALWRGAVPEREAQEEAQEEAMPPAPPLQQQQQQQQQWAEGQQEWGYRRGAQRGRWQPVALPPAQPVALSEVEPLAQPGTPGEWVQGSAGVPGEQGGGRGGQGERRRVGGWYGWEPAVIRVGPRKSEGGLESDFRGASALWAVSELLDEIHASASGWAEEASHELAEPFEGQVESLRLELLEELERLGEPAALWVREEGWLREELCEAGEVLREVEDTLSPFADLVAARFQYRLQAQRRLEWEFEERKRQLAACEEAAEELEEREEAWAALPKLWGDWKD
jgi:hypothetical protein